MTVTEHPKSKAPKWITLPFRIMLVPIVFTWYFITSIRQGIIACYETLMWGAFLDTGIYKDDREVEINYTVKEYEWNKKDKE